MRKLAALTTDATEDEKIDTGIDFDEGNEKNYTSFLSFFFFGNGTVWVIPIVWYCNAGSVIFQLVLAYQYHMRTTGIKGNIQVDGLVLPCSQLI